MINRRSIIYRNKLCLLIDISMKLTLLNVYIKFLFKHNNNSEALMTSRHAYEMISKVQTILVKVDTNISFKSETK